MTEVDRLTGTEGGRWRIWTQGSTHVMDLDAMTVTRHPGPTSGPTINDTARQIHTIHQCQVGEGGYWTMSAGGVLSEIEAYWQTTTPISKIERIDGDAER
ncbi:MAG: hypothetical protein WED09_02810 [Homoserinimonas sp.]